MLGRPVRYAAGEATLRLYPVGQIPEVLWKADFEAHERDFVNAYLRPGMRVLNVGANVGLYVAMASALVGPKGEVHAFEPSVLTYARLMKNLELNGCRNVIAKRIALSDATGQLLMRADPRAPHLDGHRFVEKPGSNVQARETDEMVEALTLDGYLGALGTDALARVDFMIMDVEGAELAALQGAQKMLASNDLTLLLECSKNHDQVEKMLRGFGYQFWDWNEETRALEPTDFRGATKKGDVIVRRRGWSAD
jgi:FkbM family methyltransferase